MKIEVCSLRDLFDEKNKYKVPDYQRPYAWGEKQIRDLWQDIEFAFKQDSNKEYLMGAVYLLKEEGESYIIDGQQRITSLYIMCRLLGLGYPTLELGNLDRDFLKSMFEGAPQTANSLSNKMLQKTKELLEGYIKNKPEEIEKYIFERLKFIKVEITDKSVMNSIFVSQTDRGKRLTNFEKIKSLLVFYGEKIGGEYNDVVSEYFGKIYTALSRLFYEDNIRDDAEIIIVRTLMVLLETKSFGWNKLGEWLQKNGRDEDWKKYYVEWFDGEDKIYEWLNTIFRENFINQNDNKVMKDILCECIKEIEKIAEFFEFLANNIENKQLKNLVQHVKPSHFSYAFLTNYYSLLNQKTIDEFLEPLTPANKKLSFEELLKNENKQIKKQYEDVWQLIQNSGNAEAQKYLGDIYGGIEKNAESYMDKFKEKNIIDYVETLELSCWKSGYKLSGNFAVDIDNKEKMIEHIQWWSNDYFVKYLANYQSWNIYKNILIEYERFYSPDYEPFGFIHNEHIYPQTPKTELKDFVFKNGWDNLDSYAGWINNIGNIALLTQKDNIEISNEMIIEKAKKYCKQQEFVSTQQIGEQIKKLSKYIGENDKNAHIYYKTLLEIRKLDLLCFIYYRF